MQNDLFSILHLFISILKNTRDIHARQTLKGSRTFLVNVIKVIPASYFKDIGVKKEKKDEFDRIVQFLSVVGTEMSFNIENQILFYAALSNIVKIIKTLDINKMNGKNLAFMISCFGKNSLHDDVII